MEKEMAKCSMRIKRGKRQITEDLTRPFKNRLSGIIDKF